MGDVQISLVCSRKVISLEIIHSVKQDDDPTVVDQSTNIKIY